VEREEKISLPPALGSYGKKSAKRGGKREGRASF
jgi:hypothetical protein